MSCWLIHCHIIIVIIVIIIIIIIIIVIIIFIIIISNVFTVLQTSLTIHQKKTYLQYLALPYLLTIKEW